MFERFTDRARRVVVLAQEEARLHSHNYIGVEHLLAGLSAEEQGIGAQVLAELGCPHHKVTGYISENLGDGAEGLTGHIPFTPRCKKVLELALRQALQLGHNYIGTEHVLLAIAKEAETSEGSHLANLGLDPAAIRQAVLAKLSTYYENRRTPSTLTIDWHAENMAQAIQRRLRGLANNGVDDVWLREAVDAYLTFQKREPA